MLARVILSSTLCASTVAMVCTQNHPLNLVYIAIIASMSLTVNVVEWVCDWGGVFSVGTCNPPPPLLHLNALRGGGTLAEGSEDSSDTDSGSGSVPSFNFKHPDLVQKMFDEAEATAR
mgnify:CR=1 FL=1